VESIAIMKIVEFSFRNVMLTMSLILMVPVVASAQTTTTTTTTTNADGSTTTTVEETVAQDSDEDSNQSADRNLVGPTGVTGTIRRADRRQDRRMEEDL
jgi:hypothetical protein